jgi:hypothetical protein
MAALTFNAHILHTLDPFFDLIVGSKIRCREQELHTISPQLRQWCFPLNIEKSFEHTIQDVTSSFITQPTL